AEIAVAITLVAGAGWLVRSFARLGTTDSGFVADGRLVFEVAPSPARMLPPPGTGPAAFNVMAERLMSWTRELSDRLRAIKGVTAIGTTSTFPFGTERDAVLYLGIQGGVGAPDHPLVARAHRVSADFFEAMGTKLIAGRGFTADDRVTTAPVAIVNRTFARRYLEGRDPLTAKFSAGYPTVPDTPLLTVVG